MNENHVISRSTLSSLAAECCIAKTSGFACNLHFAKIKHANDNLSKMLSSIAEIFPDCSHILKDGSLTKLALVCQEIRIQLFLF
jgi:hypothetical protein